MRSFDGMGRTATFNRLSNSTVECEGISVEVFVYDVGEGKNRLLWCRSPMEKTDVEGFANYLFHLDYSPEDKASTEAAQQGVRKSFRDYWKNPERLQVPGRVTA